ncbi:hypothetical protein V491_02667 [Pseudogymnoascus sp. VKM F-3775]|nr:hypothetical protein V491_02667 [Pseudogymnoascus sp. VKM F-3775]
MVDGAPAKILRRMNPRPVVYNDEQIRSTANFREKLKCIQALLLTDADVILENLRRTKGDRVEGTCEWVLVNAQFTRWLNAALWMVFEAILRSPMKRSIFIIIDALDECEEESKSNLVTMFRKFLDPNSQNNTRKPNSLAQSVKVIIVHRPEPGIEGGFPREPEPLRVDSGLINCDLSKFIKEKTVKLQQDLDLDSETSNQICDALERKAEGTFLWVSLVLGEMDKRDTQGNLTELLDKLPSGLPETFELILRKIKSTHGREASFIVRIILVACRPLKVDELAMICVLGLSAYDKTTLPTDRDLNKWRHGYRCCGAFLKLDEERQTIHLVHQSAKDFLGHLSGHNDLAGFYSERCHEKVVELLLNRGANVHFKDTASNTALIWAARASSDTIVKLLLDRGAKVNVKNGTNRTPLIWAAKEGNEEVGRLLLDHGAHVNFKAKNGSTPLSTATASDHKGFARLLIHHGAKPGQKQQKWLGDDKISS